MTHSCVTFSYLANHCIDLAVGTLKPRRYDCRSGAVPFSHVGRGSGWVKVVIFGGSRGWRWGPV